MSSRHPAAARSGAGTLVALMLWGCVGTLEEPSAGPRRREPVPPESPEHIDEMMRTEDPTLFAQAEAFFPGTTVGLTPTRLVRLGREQIDSTTRALLPGHAPASIAETMPRDPVVTNYDYADNLNVNTSNFGAIHDWVDAIAASVRAAPESVIACSPAAPECLDREARVFVLRAFRDVVTAELLDRYAAFYVTSVAAVGFPQATGDLVSVTLSSPRYLFREEVVADATGLLPPAQRLQHITYALADLPPFAFELTPDSLDAGDAAVIDTVLASEAARAKLARFFVAWLEIEEPENAFDISTEIFPELTPSVASAMVEEARRFLADQLSISSEPSLIDVMSSTDSYVPAEMAFLYGLSPDAANRIVDHDPGERRGILTMPAFLASHSGPVGSRPIHRGVFFTRKVMCLPLGAPPGDAPTMVPEIEGASVRTRVEQLTAPATCTACHAMINPFGFSLESYDALGRFRTEDDDEAPVDATIDHAFLGEGGGTTTSSVEAIEAYTGTLRFQQCFARQVFRFYTSRAETAGDDPLLRQMFFQLAVDGRQDILGMLRTYAGSPYFSRRTEER